MKKLNYLFAILLVAGVSFFTSCSEDSETTPTPALPTINFIAGAGYISTSQTMEVNTPVMFGISATASDGKLKRFFVHRTISGKPSVTVMDTTFSSSITTYNKDIVSTAQGAAGTELWEFTITDSNGGSKMISLTITTTVPTTYGPIFSYPMKVLGAQASSTGSSFASSNGLVYMLADAKINSSLIDWVYFYGATNFATLAAPSDPDAAAVFNNATNGIATWSVRNATMFKKVTDAINWDGIVNDSVIMLQNQSGVTESKINNLATGFFLAFKTAAGKEGMIRVNSLTPDNTGSITVDVKVQQ